jgi:alanine dehydrogenase
VHYCVANIPSAVARTATQALSLSTLPFVLALAAQPLKQALSATPNLAHGLSVANGHLCCAAVAGAQQRDFRRWESVL